MRSEKTQALTRRRAARRQATGALRTGRCSPPRPARGEGRPRVRPAREEARARLRSPAPLPSARRQPRTAARLAALRRPGTPRVPGPTWPPRPAPGALAGPPRSEPRGKRPGARLQLRLLPRPSCAVCVRESLRLLSTPSSPPPRTTWPPAHYSLRRGRGGPAPLPPTYGAQRSAPSPPAPSSAPPRPRLRAPLSIGRAAPSPTGPSARTASIGRAAPSFDLPTPGPRARRPRPPIGRAPRLSARRRALASGAGRSPLAPVRLLAPRARAPSARASPQGEEGGGQLARSARPAGGPGPCCRPPSPGPPGRGHPQLHPASFQP